MGGLYPPEVVTAATKEYLEAEDSVGRWLEEKCELDGSAFTSSKELFNSWKWWADEYGEFVGSVRKLSDQLIARKLVSCRQNQVRGFKGVRVKQQFHGSIQALPEKASAELESKL